MIRNMKNDGKSVRSIAKEMGISRNNVRKYLKSEPAKKNKKKRSSKPDPYRNTVKAIIDKGNLSAVRILEEIRKKRSTIAMARILAEIVCTMLKTM